MCGPRAADEVARTERSAPDPGSVLLVVLTHLALLSLCPLRRVPGLLFDRRAQPGAPPPLGAPLLLSLWLLLRVPDRPALARASRTFTA